MSNYDPGRPKSIIYDRVDGSWIVTSWRNEQEAYRVRLGEQAECSCPHHRYRLAGTGEVCKHQQQVIDHIEQVQEYLQAQA